MDKIPLDANFYYLVDRGYVKFDSLYQNFHLNNAFFDKISPDSSDGIYFYVIL